MKKAMKRAVSLLLCLMIFCALLTVPVSAAEANGVSDGRAVYTFSSLTRRLKNALSELLQRLNVSLPQSGGENAQGPAGSDTAAEEKRPESGAADAVSAYESKVIELVNAERAKYGLAPLRSDKALADGAREKSADMQRRGYFSHTSPTYGSPFDQMRAWGIVYRSAGENIAMGYATPEAVVRAWMNSEGHRANILNGRYTEIGVGYVQQGNYCTQWFIG